MSTNAKFNVILHGLHADRERDQKTRIFRMSLYSIDTLLTASSSCSFNDAFNDVSLTSHPRGRPHNDHRSVFLLRTSSNKQFLRKFKDLSLSLSLSVY